MAAAIHGSSASTGSVSGIDGNVRFDADLVDGVTIGRKVFCSGELDGLVEPQ